MYELYIFNFIWGLGIGDWGLHDLKIYNTIYTLYIICLINL